MAQTCNIIRAWKDAEYRASLSAAELAQLPEMPAGLIDLTDADVEAISGAHCPVVSPVFNTKFIGCYPDDRFANPTVPEHRV
jgi:mersacidin/lichenicidin family type 2 lantibiotic